MRNRIKKTTTIISTVSIVFIVMIIFLIVYVININKQEETQNNNTLIYDYSLKNPINFMQNNIQMTLNEVNINKKLAQIKIKGYKDHLDINEIKIEINNHIYIFNSYNIGENNDYWEATYYADGDYKEISNVYLIINKNKIMIELISNQEIKKIKE
jgi:hypothetical protein